MADRPDVPDAVLERLEAVLGAFPQCRRERAWVGERWRVAGATVAHVFGGEDGLLRLTFRARGDELHALEHLGPPYFRAEWGSNVAGVVLGERTDWDELAELLTDTYCLQAPAHLVVEVEQRGDAGAPGTTGTTARISGPGGGPASRAGERQR